MKQRKEQKQQQARPTPPLPSRLSGEEADALETAINSDGYRVLVYKVLPGFIKKHKDRLFSHDVQDQNSLLALAVLKAENNGMQLLLNEVEALIARSKKED